MIISHVVATAENGVIGRDGGLPWHIPADLKRFKAATMGKMVLMGRKTYASVGRPLPGRLNIVVTRAQGAEREMFAPGVVVCADLDAALHYAAAHAHEWQNELCIIGGGEIYAQTMDKVNIIYLSRVHMTVDGDTYYPALPTRFALMEKEEHEGSPSFSWCVYGSRPAI
jgi:dihydrofolate reductase